MAMRYGKIFAGIVSVSAFAAAILLRAPFAHAAVVTWDGGGADTNWNTCANWTLDTCPGSSDIATFDGTSTKNVTINTGITVGGIDINTGYTGIITQMNTFTVNLGTTGAWTQDAGTFTGGDSAIDLGSFTLAGGTFQSTSGTMSVNEGWTHTAGGTFTHRSGAVRFTGNSSAFDVATSETFYNVTIDKSHGQTLTIATGDTMIPTGQMTYLNGLLSGGTVEKSGPYVTSVGPGFDGGTTLLKFTGSDTHVFNLGGATDKFDADIEIAKSGGSLTMYSDLIMDASGQDLTITSGTFTTYNGTTNYALTIAGNLTVNGGTISLNASTVDLNGNVTIGGGTLDAGSASISLAGNIAFNSGTMTQGTSTVTMDTGSQQMTGNVNFYNFTKTGTGTLTLDNTATVTVTGTLTLQGTSSGSMLTLVSDSAGNQATLAPSGSIATLQYIDVRDNDATVQMACSMGCTDSGNNTNWTFTRRGGGGYVAPTVQTVTLVSPNGGETWVEGSDVEITWSWTGSVDLVNVLVSTDGGETWETLASALDNAGFYDWEIASDATDEAMIRIDATDLVTAYATDSSDEVFTIAASGAVEEDEEDDVEGVANVHDLVKLADDGDPSTQTDSAVYYIGADGKRHAFPNEAVFKTWFANFDDVEIISASELASYPLGANVTYRPGARMVKFQSSPKVYAVDRYGVLRWIGSEAIATSLYGSSWNQQIHDISDAFFRNYTFGETIDSVSDYDVDDVYSSVEYPSDSLAM